MSRPDIFSYLDYRSFLKDLYEFKKASNSKYSYQLIASKIGIDKATIYKVIKFDRHLPLDQVIPTAEAFNLTAWEIPYFEKLVLYGRSSQDKEKDLFLEELKKLRPISQFQLDRDQFEFFDSWYHIVVWLIIGIREINDTTPLQHIITPKVAPAHLKASILLLTRLNLIKVNSLGFYEKTSENLTLGHHWKSEQIHQYLETSIQLATKAVRQFEKDERDISALVLDMPSEKLPEVKQKINDFRKDLIQLINSYGQSDEVYQLSIQFFPLTQLEETP